MSWYASFATLTLCVGMMLIAAGGALFYLQRKRIRRSLAAEGTVIELIRQRALGDYLVSRTEEGKVMRPKYLYRPRVRFRTSSGQVVVFTPSLALRPEPYQVGQRVDVLYPPDHPTEAQINRFWYLWFKVIILICIGVLWLGLGLLGRLMAR